MLWAHRVMDFASFSVALDQSNAAEYGEVLGDSLPCEWQLRRQRRRGNLAMGEEQVKHHAPRRVSDGLEQTLLGRG